MLLAGKEWLVSRMKEVALILSIIASVGTIISIILNFKVKAEVRAIRGDRNIQSTGPNSVNNTGDGNTFK